MFSRPIEERYPIKRFYGDKGREFEWSIDPDNGFWIPIKDKEGFGHHPGTDFATVDGVLVRAMADGMVIRVRTYDPPDSHTGKGIYILQLVNKMGFDSWTICYSHLKVAFVQPGHKMFHGEPIGMAGMLEENDFIHVDLMNLQRQWKAIPLEG